jgi:hypothetical protein
MSTKKITILLFLGLAAFSAFLMLKGVLGVISDVNDGKNVSGAATPVPAQLAGGDEAQEIEKILSGLDEDQLRQLQEQLGK